MQSGVPLIWFFGVGKGVFTPVFPVHVVGEEEESRQFILDPNPSAIAKDEEGVAEQFLRQYLRAESRNRLFQAVFRGTVMRAYQGRCAVCSLQRGWLLDAAYILPDSNNGRSASVVNGIALCKIHHAAFDVRILGIRPDHVIEIRSKFMQELDDLKLRPGLQEMHGRRIKLPSARAEWPSVELLERAYERFRRAS